MKNARQLAALVTIAVIMPVATAVNATEGVSPGAGDRLAVIRDGCPTFSWGAVDDAEYFEVVAYRLPEGEGFIGSAEVELSKDNEVLYTRVAGTATAWTPSLERCFVSGVRYVWFVRAVFDENETAAVSDWSQGLFFLVAGAPSAQEVQQAFGVLQRFLAGGGRGGDELAALISGADSDADADAGADHRTRNSGTSKMAGRALPGTAAIRGEQPDPTGETFGVYGISNSSTDGSIGVVGESTAATGEVYGVGGITASVDGAGVIAFNSANGTDLILGADSSSAHLTELGLTRSLPGPATFDIENPDGAGTMTLRVDGVDVVTTATDRDALGGLSCASGEVAKWNGSAWVCAPDDGTAFIAGNQLELDGTTLNVLEGDGSGLDADTLDSHDADYFATEVHDHFDQTWIGSGSHGLRAENSAPTGFGLIGWGTSPTGVSYGVFGKSTSPSGYGVWGWASALSGATYGVSGLTNSSSGRGVHGEAISAIGLTYGVYGVSGSNSGRGVYGIASSLAGPTNGVYGETPSIEGTGVYGTATSASGLTRGVFGSSDSISGWGVHGYTSASSGPTRGVSGVSSSNEGHGVHGEASSSSGVTSGVYGVSGSTSGLGVWGVATATSGVGKGVYGRTEASEGYGVVGYVVSTTGVNYGVNGRTDSAAGYGGYFNNEGGGVDIMAGGSGDVAQTLEGNGLVKAAMVTKCYESGTFIDRSFNNVPNADPMTISWESPGVCRIDFGFDVTNRFVVATDGALGLGNHVIECTEVVGEPASMDCIGVNVVSGGLGNFSANILVY